MREIKFRAWDEKGKQMIENEELMFSGADGFYAMDENGIDFPFDKIMQYTGLKDKNGKEIYEGDILAQGEMKAEVVYEERSFEACCQSDDGTGSWNLLGTRKWAEVIGNVFENPNLIK